MTARHSRRCTRRPADQRLEAAAEKWLTAAKAGIVRTRSGEPCKPSALWGDERVLRSRILPELGSRRLSAIAVRRCRLPPLSDHDRPEERL